MAKHSFPHVNNWDGLEHVAPSRRRLNLTSRGNGKRMWNLMSQRCYLLLSLESGVTMWLSDVISCHQLLSITSYFLQLHAILCYAWLLLFAAIRCYMLLFAGVCCYLLLFVAGCCNLLLFVAACCCLLFFYCCLLLLAEDSC